MQPAGGKKAENQHGYTGVREVEQEGFTLPPTMREKNTTKD
jgi:hypothetical protein